MTQTDAIRQHLEAGKTLTPIEALNRYGCLRLAARIADLKREGFPVRSRIARRGEKRFSEYWKAR